MLFRSPEMVRRGPCARAKLAFLWRLWRGKASVEYKRFQDYFIDHGGPPTTHHAAVMSDGGRHYESMPGILGLVTALARGSGWDPETIWALPPGAAEWYLAGIFTHRGVDMRLKTTHDEEFEEGMRREKAEKREV